MSKMVNTLSLCRKAGALITGFDAVREAVLQGKTSLVLLAGDTSPGTKERAARFCESLCEICTIPDTQFALCAVTKKPVGVFCVTDDNLAALCRKTLGAQEAQGANEQTEERP